MKEIANEEMLEIIGGISITAAFVNALSRVANTIMDAGRALGSAIRRISTNNMCPCK